jgi:CheY-like chemotaxis protein
MADFCTVAYRKNLPARERYICCPANHPLNKKRTPRKKIQEHKSVIRDILIMDDHKDCADSLAMLMRQGGHHVYVAYSAMQALELAKQHRPDVFLLDLGMPILDGYTVAVRLRQEMNFSQALIIAVTGYGMAGDRARTTAAGFDQHLTQPIDSAKLLGLLSTELAASRV